MQYYHYVIWQLFRKTFSSDVISFMQTGLFQSNTSASVALSQSGVRPLRCRASKTHKRQQQIIIVRVDWTGLTSCHWASVSLAAVRRLCPSSPSHSPAVPASSLPSSAAVPPGGLRAGHTNGMSLRDLLLVWRNEGKLAAAVHTDRQTDSKLLSNEQSKKT